MTGQVKEELLTRLLETGVRIDDGEIHFDPILLRSGELLGSLEPWEVYDLDGSRHEIDIPAKSLGMTLCQVPVIVTVATDEATIEVTYSDGTRLAIDGGRIDRDTSRAIFGRSGRVSRVVARVRDR